MNHTPIRARFPIKIGQTLVPAGTEGFAFHDVPESIQKVFPNMGIKVNGFVCVEFPGLEPCLVLRKQIEVIPKKV